jgi:hypothetical protein
VFELHRLLANTLILYMAVCAMWGIAVGLRQRPVGDAYRGALLIGEALFVLQGLMGLVLLASGMPMPPWVHLIYGVVGVIVIPALLGYVVRGAKRESLWLGLGALFLTAIAVRGIMTGAP